MIFLFASRENALKLLKGRHCKNQFMFVMEPRQEVKWLCLEDMDVIPNP